MTAENQLIAIEVKPLDLERAVLRVFFNRGMSVDEMNSLHRWMNEHLVERTHSRPVMNSPADEAEARDRANTAPPQADPDARSRGLTGASSGSEARPVTATELLASENQVVCAVCDGEKPFDEHAAGCPLHPDVRPSKDGLYGDLAGQFLEITYSDPPIQAQMAIRDFAEWLDKRSAPDVRANLRCGTCGELHVEGGYYNHNHVPRGEKHGQ